MKAILAIRNGKVQIRIPRPEIRTDGSVWYNGNPLFDGQSKAVAEMGGASAVGSLAKARDWSKIPSGCFAKMGLSDSGLLVIDEAEYNKAQEKPITPAMRERGRIAALYAKAQRRIDDTDDNNVSDHFGLLAEADAALAAWRTQYPTEAAAEDRSRLLSKAAHLRELAAGLLTYDCDGSLSAADQQRRHDEYINQAVEIESKI